MKNKILFNKIVNKNNTMKINIDYNFNFSKLNNLNFKEKLLQEIKLQ